jgi:hypothetical protein
MCPGKYKTLKLKKGPKIVYAKFYLKLFFITWCILYEKEWFINYFFLFFTEIYASYHKVTNFHKF